MTYPKGALVRYGIAGRINHWITAGCFVLLVLSGLSMFHPMLFFLSQLFGGGQWTRAVHPWIGVILMVSYSGLIIQFWRDQTWTKDDLAWTKAMDHVLANEEEGVPEVARFNAGQKFVFWAMALLVSALFFSGLMIWEVYFFPYSTIEQQRVALLVHSLAAIAAIVIWIVHVYAGLWIRGSLRAMMHGWVTPGWAYRHHRKWFRSLVDTGSRGPSPNGSAVPVRKSQ
ncbi:formate dehydrogenase subunit gamma [Bradyrhizobium sp. CB2312]|uniref:formate dehydrogenase subunit gamma n=1 Tax=Bradyrhizobium sp. CB2312 TaxID=3039155 RepID=UPI0024B26FFE|nr:formate dehydrogenase subunit gamma [Bradyrhizobium sp. CB2312]WFU73415.1 formate dehydrogenase subunit gamma [Bradyrhizobium sp. CB2312]